MQFLSISPWKPLCIVLLLATFTSAADAANRLAGDQITLRSGSKLRGILFEQSDKTVTLLVTSKWLAATNAKLKQTTSQQNIAEHKAGLEQAVQRLKADPPMVGEAAVAAFLKQQLEDADADLAQAGHFEPEFLWLTLSKKDVTRVEAALPEQRQLMAWAWIEQLDRVETRSADELSRELKARDVAPIGWPLPFIEQLPAREQSEDEWAARLALADYALGKRLDFQGTGAVLARAGREIQQADVGQLLIELMRNQLQTQLGDLFGEGNLARKAADKDEKAESLKKAIQTAEAEKRSGFRVTRLDIASDYRQATVTTQFMVRFANGSWHTVFQHTERADPQQARPELEKRIQDDPQVKQVLAVSRQIGLTADEQIQQAIRFGAATMTAQQICDREFAAFRDVYLASLVRPPLSIERGQ